MDDRSGRDVMVVIAKLTYAVGPGGNVSLAVPPSPIRAVDVPNSDKPNASIRFPSDLVDDKPGTDVVLLGTAYPPRGKEVTEQVVSLRVTGPTHALSKSVKVFGARVWHSGLLGVTPGPAAPLGPTPLVYELSYGGVDDGDHRAVTIDRRNPAGIGHVSDRTRLLGLPAPPIEGLRPTLGTSSPTPAGFGAIAVGWEPRVARFGTPDVKWRRDRAPARPLDFDLRFNSCASPDLWSETPLLGDEVFEIVGATPSGGWRFRLPAYRASFRSVIRGVATDLPTHLDLVLIDADAGRVELTWRASTPMPRRVDDLEAMQIFGEGELPEAMIQEVLRASAARRGTEA
ncbi:MAG: DUF2169 domain-containing protein [Byssovorax sp.]